MGEQHNNDLAVQIARFGEQLRSVAASLEDIRTSVQPVAALDRAIAEMAIHNQNARKDIELLWARVTDGKKERDALEQQIGDVDDRVAAMKNTARGAMWVLGIVLGIVQTFLVGSIVWVFTHINEGDILNRLQQQRLEVLEQAVTRGTK
ncbi:hypothetical protein R69658_05378 [Paraburkholderia aspalathi]|uniref:Uncharacterized protein n=1 Tax=Paraburkholderia aspalathi TaxID=1324617 RepID=A0ABM8SI51_9BURK|nr:hypothetical protein [Paraburkholderia aspalathi]MBK3821755.1 hypothetical protein [Paraburkholderia aspalathi]MBK3833641.1 hypothetical protein [Paraburkholderia aspalathi]MBK3863364.1 hypothetical protein [Paraburkholderia aspalathi]CAE6810512.1 hypothetical protein R69658_05378 [Paraburkholderia aspalathi]